MTPRLRELALRASRGMAFGLDRVRTALEGLGDPQDAVPAVHIAGTNGKGSTAAMLEAIARAAGLRTGLTTSPHLCRVAERIRVDGEPLDDARFEDALAAVLDRCPPSLTFFESLIVASFVAFRDANVDLAIVEVGLGGRLDATNVMRKPLATAITSIAFDHTELLGTTLAAIAREKAGILRSGVPLVLGPLANEAYEAIAEVVHTIGAGPVVRVAPPFPDRALGLFGEHQRANAAVAEALAEVLAPRFPGLRAHVTRGLAEVRWPGRFERIERDGVTIVLDCAHNPEGAEALSRALEGSGIDAARTTLVFGALADKAWEPMLRTLSGRARRRIYTQPKGRAPAPLEELRRVAEGEAIGEPIGAIERAIARSERGDFVVVTGSSYLVGEVRAFLFGIEGDPTIAL